MRKVLTVTVACFLLLNLVWTSNCLAQDPLKKLGRGVSNLALGWIEIFTTIEDTGKSDGIVGAATYGFLKGIAKAIQRTAVGVYETLSFPIPVPADYKPILTKPEFVLGKEAKE